MTGVHPDLARHQAAMEAGADMYFTNRSYEVVEMLAKEGIPVQVHMGLVPSLSHWCGGLRAFGRTAEEAMQIIDSPDRFAVEPDDQVAAPESGPVRGTA